MGRRGLRSGRVAQQKLTVRGFSGVPPRLGDIHVPTALIHGTEDRLISEEASRVLAQGIRGSTLHLMAGMGHELPQGLWEHFADIICTTADRADPDAGRVA